MSSDFWQVRDPKTGDTRRPSEAELRRLAKKLKYRHIVNEGHNVVIDGLVARAPSCTVSRAFADLYPRGSDRDLADLVEGLDDSNDARLGGARRLPRRADLAEQATVQASYDVGIRADDICAPRPANQLETRWHVACLGVAMLSIATFTPICILLLCACSASPSSEGTSSNDHGPGGSGSVGAGGSVGSGGSGGGIGLGGTPGAGGSTGAEVCGDGLDNDSSGEVDEGCTCSPGATQQCFSGDSALAGIGSCTWGSQSCASTGTSEIETGAWGPCTGSGAPSPEVCDNLDNDCNGTVDDDCQCVDGTTQPCSTACGAGTQTCVNLTWTECDAPKPSPTGACNVVVDINVNGDCVCAPACPPEAPYPVGCNVSFSGGNSKGCVAAAQNGAIYFQEGVMCDAGQLSGTVTCSSIPGLGLNASNCPINKGNPYYGQKPSDCPGIESGAPAACYY